MMPLMFLTGRLATSNEDTCNLVNVYGFVDKQIKPSSAVYHDNMAVLFSSLHAKMLSNAAHPPSIPIFKQPHCLSARNQLRYCDDSRMNCFMLLHSTCSALQHGFVTLYLQCRSQDWYTQYAAQGRRNSSSRVTVFPLYAPIQQGLLPSQVDMQPTCEAMLLTQATVVTAVHAVTSRDHFLAWLQTFPCQLSDLREWYQD